MSKKRSNCANLFLSLLSLLHVITDAVLVGVDALRRHRHRLFRLLLGVTDAVLVLVDAKLVAVVRALTRDAKEMTFNTLKCRPILAVIGILKSLQGFASVCSLTLVLLTASTC